MQRLAPNVSQSSPKGGHPGRQLLNRLRSRFTKPAIQLVPVTTAASQYIYIRIHRDLVLPVPTVATNPPVAPPTASPHLPSHLYLIEGTFEDVRRFAGTTVDWVIKIVHLICDPLGIGQVYIHTTGTPSDWYNVDRAASWRQVAPGDALLPGIYEFEPVVPILLSKVSERRSRSVTSLGSVSSSSAFREHIGLRDDGCVVTRYHHAVIASHLIPKRLGSDGAKSIVTRFSGEQAALDIHSFDPRIGILLFCPLDVLVDNYQLGFYHVTGHAYSLHNFSIIEPDLSVVGAPPSGPLANVTGITPLHNYSTTLSVHSGKASLPLKGVFDWHYLQCVIERFGTPEYKHLPDIQFLVYPFKSASDDSNDEYPDDDETEPPYPSYHFDRYLAEQGERLRAQELREEVLQWSSGIPSGL